MKPVQSSKFKVQSWITGLLLLLFATGGFAADAYPGEQRDLALAKKYAPVFYQRLSGVESERRFDYITNFDFDGDWTGNNNWENAAEKKYPMRGYVYYSVVESASHYFITYSVFHARDWSNVEPLLSGIYDQIQKSEKYGKYLPPELRQQIEFNHENDFEGAQLVVRKASGALPERLEAVETISHDEFHAYAPADTPLTHTRGFDGTVTLEQGRPQLYVESQKHGVHAYPYQHQHRTGSIFDAPGGPLLVYRYRGTAEDPDAAKAREEVGYDLLPLYSTFWTRARGLKAPNKTFGEIFDFADLYCKELAKYAPVGRLVGDACKLGSMGVALKGDFAGRNRALLPWGWFSYAEPQLRAGDWFLNPLQVMDLHYRGAEFSRAYVSHPFIGVFREN